MVPGKIKRLMFWIILVALNLGIVELACSEIFFQKASVRPLAIVYFYHEAKRILFHWNLTPIGIFAPDPRMGYSHVANSVGRHREADFDVTYTIGNDKDRYIPAPKAPRGRILFLGCSYTFGFGVQDTETFPYLLSKQWPDWQTVNKAVMGWGTSHAYLVLSEELSRADPPSMVIYAMLTNHIQRNYIRKSWVEMSSAGWIVRHKANLPIQPHFELVDNRLVYEGLVNVANSQADSSEMRDKEVELTRAFLLEMHQMCQQRGIPFVIIYLGPLPPRYIVQSAIDSNISALDLSGISFELFPSDGHPNPRDHQQIAEAISKSFVPKLIENLAGNRSSLSAPASGAQFGERGDRNHD